MNYNFLSIIHRVNYFISNVLTSSLLGGVADVVGNNNNNS